jgi:predicted metal-dependent hydrolase
MPEDERKEQKTEQPVEHKDVPYEAHKEIVNILEQCNRRLIYTIVFMISVIFLAIITGIWFFGQYDYDMQTVTVDSTDGIANYVGGDGSITNGGTGD